MYRSIHITSKNGDPKSSRPNNHTNYSNVESDGDGETEISNNAGKTSNTGDYIPEIINDDDGMEDSMGGATSVSDSNRMAKNVNSSDKRDDNMVFATESVTIERKKYCAIIGKARLNNTIENRKSGNINTINGRTENGNMDGKGQDVKSNGKERVFNRYYTEYFDVLK